MQIFFTFKFCVHCISTTDHTGKKQTAAAAMQAWARSSPGLAFFVAFVQDVHHFLTPPEVLSIHSVCQHPSANHITHSAVPHHFRIISAGLICSSFYKLVTFINEFNCSCNIWTCSSREDLSLSIITICLESNRNRNLEHDFKNANKIY